MGAAGEGAGEGREGRGGVVGGGECGGGGEEGGGEGGGASVEMVCLRCGFVCLFPPSRTSPRVLFTIANAPTPTTHHRQHRHRQWVRPKETYGIEVDGFQLELHFPGPDVTELPLRIALHRRQLVRACVVACCWG